MSGLVILILAFVLMFAFMAVELPIGPSIALAAFVGFGLLKGWGQAFDALGMIPHDAAASYTFSVIPLFVLMASLLFYSGVSKDLYAATRAWLGRLPGGLGMATAAACGAFAAVCASSVATALTIGTVALPEMKRYRYDVRLATGCVAAGGTLGPLIPPSIGFIIYSIITGESIGKLFIAGIFPGILLMFLFMITTYIWCRVNPVLGPLGPSIGLREKFASLKGLWATIVLFFVVIGGMYAGVFTVTEAAAIGAFASFLIVLVKKQLTRANFMSAVVDTGKFTAMAFILLIGALLISYFTAATEVAFYLADLVAALAVPPIVIMIAILLIWLILGTFMEMLPITIITVPILYPMVIDLGFSGIWFGVAMVIMAGLAFITPPVGGNMFVIAAVAKVPVETVFGGVGPYVLAMIVCMAIVLVFPQIATWLPSMMR